MDDSIDTIVAELKALPARRRRELIAALAPDERRALLPWLDEPAAEPAPVTKATPVMPHLSPPLRERLETVLAARPSPLTATARRELELALAAGHDGQTFTPAGRPRGASLLGRLLPARKAA